MKTLLLALLAFSSVTQSFADSKKNAKNPAFAETWIQNAKAYEGKKVTTHAIEVGEIGGVASSSKVAVVPIVTGAANGTPGASILVLLPSGKVKDFLDAVAPKKAEKGGAFGTKVVRPPVNATFITVKGEGVLVYGAVTPEMKETKPSDLLAEQLKSASAQTSSEPAETGKKTADKPAGKKIR